MTTVDVLFTGICTHIRNLPITWAVAQPSFTTSTFVRGIAVDGSLGMLGPDNQTIPPHVPLLYIPPQYVVNMVVLNNPAPFGLESAGGEGFWKLRGAQLYIANSLPAPDGAPLLETESFLASPSLTASAQVLSLNLDPRVVLGGRAACTFDMYGGTVHAMTNTNASYPGIVHTHYTIETQGDATLMIKRAIDQQITVVMLRDAPLNSDPLLPTNPQVYISNTGADTDENVDFLLHYDVTTWSPYNSAVIPQPEAGAVVPATTIEQQSLDYWASQIQPMTITFGCSNSNYP